MRILKIGILFVICHLTFVISSHGATWLDPSYKWKTIETPHFSIHYPKQLEEIAKGFAPEAEGIHNRLSPLFRHTPEWKTNVVLVDNYDYGNGMTTVIPNPLVILYVTDLGSNLSPYSYKEWLKYVFLHEYTHVLHLDTIEGGAQLTKLLFGRILFPNALSPRFIVEGLAVYMESHYGSGGRVFNPRFEAQMRVDILEKKLKTIEQASMTTIYWPGGNLSYIYGAYFIEYLAEKYGEEKLFRLSREYGDYILYDGIESCFRVIFGKKLADLWQDWLADLDKKYADYKTKEIVPTFTSSGYYNLQPAWSDNSDDLYYTHRDFGSYPLIRRLNLSSGKDTKVAELSAFDDSMSILKNRLLFSKPQYYNNFYYYKDLYLMDLASSKISRLTFGERTADPAFSPLEDEFVFTKLNQGGRSLWLYDLKAKIRRQIGDEDPSISYFAPVFSPDGKKIAAAKKSSGDQSIYLLDYTKGWEKKIADFGLCGNPFFSPDGEYLLFDSDRSGTGNIYAYRLSDQKIFQVTDVPGMAIMPKVSPDGKKLAYVNYSSRGYDIAVVPLDPLQWVEPDEKRYRPPAVADIKPLELSVSPKGYYPFPALLPKLWMPLSVVDENGRHTSIFTTSFDSLTHHAYEMQLSYDAKAERPIYEIYYANNQLFPQIFLEAIDFPVNYRWDNNSKIYWERYLSQAVYASFPKYALFSEYDSQAITCSFENINLNNITSLDALTAIPATGNVRGVGLGYSYSNSRTYAVSISPEDGIDLYLSSKFYSKALGSDYSFTNYSISSNQYLPTPVPHHILAFSETGFLSRGEQLSQSDFTWRYLTLRGYPTTYFSGSKGGKATLEYRFPVAYMENGLSYGLTFFDRAFGKFFFDVGGSTFGNVSNIYLSKSAGGEISLSTVNGFGYVPIVLTLGYAVGMDPGGEGKLYFGISSYGQKITKGGVPGDAKRSIVL
ncbi:hypothetical protein A2276_03855 [candidate division WOR-1 bacterium RIFOXYA12_FULL_43_27]|uniref:Bacterial surface antigen (D15) domain-containing protein n=1 Tax=candidate division WOR-1 bacterium RIFOXYC2_FULL_46_14 TaxID=1802587 RepID=A0A1F4U8Z6_UNCSA|nr:MAG: hypothetical protein A2276_03855 [candidate division WOR-1 bacterium RIFOXYA12_FULL_43_27]OGC19172.1 MAG: hypothetical protein A2292_00480 [candidate division WOR-1 bacterium RIFOXYB2_FULL_46_45]OGC30161.1 MAG: hypothetical protein A2232_00480 [candidate division WOR-1 bacterium RIFOXYA2_FULL_46_56]OGC40763.1 MAG: hypothetical protein A2438_00485 [candidate division WOR-1 bacterium RIFOXYC2_FULL_46_14]